MKRLQKKVGKFVDERKWAETYHVYGVLLNIVEEIGELWNVVKHLEKDEEKLKKVVAENKEELEDSVGDITYLVLKLAHILRIDAEEATEKVLKEFEKRFPAEKLRGHHGNLRAGGVDFKYQ